MEVNPNYELEECPVCRGNGFVVHEGGWNVQVECTDCVMGNDQSRAVDVFDDVRHGKRFTAARYADQNLRTNPV